MTITIGEAYMLHRRAPHSLSARALHRWTFAVGGVLIATATAFAWWAAIDVRPLKVSDAGSCVNQSWPYRDRACRNDNEAVEESRSIRFVSSDRIQETTIDTAAPLVEIPTATSSEATEPVPQAPTSSRDAIVLQPSAERVARFVPPQTRKVRAISPRARAEMPRVQKRNAERGPAPRLGPALGLGFAPAEKSFTGAGGAFDAVH
jgi:hypothetical protein